MIPYGKQNINQDDIDAVVEVLKSDFLTQGPKVFEFEKDLANYCQAQYAKAVCNGTAALHLAYLAIGLKKNDIVWTVANTFVATANAALYCGASVDFVDIDPDTYNMSVECLEEKLAQAKKDNKLPKLVVPVHFAGQSCQMKEIWDLAQEYGFKVVEDACHALGSDYKNKKVGSCEYSDMTVFSFHPVKMITMGEGGAIMTNNKILDDKVALLRSHGITKDCAKFVNQSDGDWYYEQQALGFNYRLTDIQAALGISQLKRLDNFVATRRAIAKRYLSELKNIDLPVQHPDTNSSWHLFVIKTDNRTMLFQQLKKQDILPQVHYIPITQQPFYNAKTLQNNEDFYQHCLSLPIYIDLTENEQTKVIKCL
ncbi:Bacillosamine/Legionaminic acid biosynthesis aminotransferase PglE; 4-keto-6-deoxy-N-Acetyl-D-hexosaminyl-(Lipid carrier) aminotransferase [uncultured Candidatus Thioglobus sp.]|nr:Bacillosamine/Legionaminic acid biosynthesis aminotransferase PglE; 4-keto-6-deoxy-N-Acetyl-D-hexosaminyl-(Lipid carrier) aminotransferase [uncultured Candidatus Thioglobus sp.]